MTPPESKLGHIIWGLELVELLGSGGYGAVYLGIDREKNERFAVKCIFKTHLSEEQLYYQRLEVSLHLQANEPPHPNIVRLYEVVEDDDCLFLVLEYCSHRDLFYLLQEELGYPDCMAKRVFMQLLDAVKHCHSRNVYHRDIKPENILLDEKWNLKLGDFGLATNESWTTDLGCGSMPYMAPECHDDPENHDGYSPALADVWSLGVILFNLLFGKNPWHKASNDLCDPIYAAYCRDPSSLRYPVSHEVANVFARIFTDACDRCTLPELIEMIKPIEVFTVFDDTMDDEDGLAAPSLSNDDMSYNSRLGYDDDRDRHDIYPEGEDDARFVPDAAAISIPSTRMSSASGPFRFHFRNLNDLSAAASNAGSRINSSSARSATAINGARPRGPLLADSSNPLAASSGQVRWDLPDDDDDDDVNSSSSGGAYNNDLGHGHFRDADRDELDVDDSLFRAIAISKQSSMRSQAGSVAARYYNNIGVPLSKNNSIDKFSSYVGSSNNSIIRASMSTSVSRCNTNGREDVFAAARMHSATPPPPHLHHHHHHHQPPPRSAGPVPPAKDSAFFSWEDDADDDMDFGAPALVPARTPRQARSPGPASTSASLAHLPALLAAADASQMDQTPSSSGPAGVDGPPALVADSEPEAMDLHADADADAVATPRSRERQQRRPDRTTPSSAPMSPLPAPATPTHARAASSPAQHESVSCPVSALTLTPASPSPTSACAPASKLHSSLSLSLPSLLAAAGGPADDDGTGGVQPASAKATTPPASIGARAPANARVPLRRRSSSLNKLSVVPPRIVLGVHTSLEAIYENTNGTQGERNPSHRNASTTPTATPQMRTRASHQNLQHQHPQSQQTHQHQHPQSQQTQQHQQQHQPALRRRFTQDSPPLPRQEQMTEELLNVPFAQLSAMQDKLRSAPLRVDTSGHLMAAHPFASLQNSPVPGVEMIADAHAHPRRGGLPSPLPFGRTRPALGAIRTGRPHHLPVRSESSPVLLDGSARNPFGNSSGSLIGEEFGDDGAGVRSRAARPDDHEDVLLPRDDRNAIIVNGAVRARPSPPQQQSPPAARPPAPPNTTGPPPAADAAAAAPLSSKRSGSSISISMSMMGVVEMSVSVSWSRASAASSESSSPTADTASCLSDQTAVTAADSSSFSSAASSFSSSMSSLDPKSLALPGDPFSQPVSSLSSSQESLASIGSIGAGEGDCGQQLRSAPIDGRGGHSEPQPAAPRRRLSAGAGAGPECAGPQPTLPPSSAPTGPSAPPIDAFAVAQALSEPLQFYKSLSRTKLFVIDKVPVTSRVGIAAGSPRG